MIQFVLRSKWKYGETGRKSSIYGPKDWGKVSRHCTGNSQSPINIDTRNISHHRHLSFLRGFYADTRKIGAQLVNNGHAPTFNVDLGTAFLAGGPWGSNRYKLEQFHFHFGCTARTGSEHKVNSFQYSGELHLVYYNTKYKDFKTAVDKTDGLTVIGVFLQETNSRRDNYELLKLYDKLTKVTKTDDDVKIRVYIHLATLVPALASMSWTYFFSYKGSLTTPPCYQSVNWIVLYKPIPASTKVMNAFRRLKNNEGRPMCNNFRPVQPLNGRMVTWYGTLH
ncbi:carbonic anhydrase 2-like [Stylophora pistillata]|uniref:carbonic anhydrase 2-like n=1 Tax=Stylophora pistillata TaxID=50429 RepID=UPI000C04826B|nr:carbonic anhydrase 2-like [Stylophora pistillata]